MMLWSTSVSLMGAKCRYANVFTKIVALISNIIFSVAMMCVMLNVFMECYYYKCLYAECEYTVVMVRVEM